MTKNLLDQQRLKDTEPASQAILDKWLAQSKGRLFTMKGAGFLGSLLCNHQIIWDDNCPTGWCNGSTIGLSPKFFTYLNRDTRVTLLAHEIYHTGYDHMSRMKGFDPEIWNMAADYVINNDMVKDGFSFEGMGGLIDSKYADMSTEQIYKLLIESGMKPPPMMHLIDPGEGGEDKEGTGNNPGNIPSMCGDLRAPTADGTKEIMTKIITATQASRMSNEAGVVPGETELIVDEFLNPVLPWEVLLQKYFSEMSNDDYSWRRPSRRYEDEYLPSMYSDDALEHLMFVWDISGSITDEEIIRANSEVKYVWEQFNPKKLTVVTFDTEIHDIIEFTEGEPFEKVKIHGRGGTDLNCVQKFLKEKKPTAAIIFSDLYCYPMTPDPGVPIVWVIIDNKSAQTSFGTNIHMRRDQI